METNFKFISLFIVKNQHNVKTDLHLKLLWILKGKNNLKQKIDSPVINPLEPEKAEPVIPAQTLQPLPFPIKKRRGGRPGVGGNFFESNQNLKLKGLTLYEKTLVCLDKLRLNS
mgnify:CR=1 FL=1